MAQLELQTAPKWLKKSRLTKIATPAHFVANYRIESSMNINGNFNYENSVNNQRQREGVDDEQSSLWEAMPLPWGTRVYLNGKATPFINLRGNLYFQCRLIKYGDCRTVDISTGNEVTDDISEYCEKKNESEDNEHQGTEKKIEVRSPKIENIKAILYQDQRLEIV